MLSTIYLDAPVSWQIGFQDPATPVMEGIINFHHDLFFFIVAIVIFVFRLLYRAICTFSRSKVNVSKEGLFSNKGGQLKVINYFKTALAFSTSKKGRSYANPKAAQFGMYSFEKGRKATTAKVTRSSDLVYTVNAKKNVTLNTNDIYAVTHASTLEIIWTIIPACILILISVPSFALLYTMDEVIDPLLTVKIIGHQWYWNYEFINPLEWLVDSESQEAIFSNFSFDSYMVPSEDLLPGRLRLLEVDNRLYLPIEINIRLSITSGDVLHSWAVPSLGVKVDACPGRINQTTLFIKRPSIFYGQCSELCGINHGFMPIAVHAVDLAMGFQPTPTVLSAAYPLFMNVYYPEAFE